MYIVPCSAVLDSGTFATLVILPFIACGPFPTCFRCACAAGFIAYGAFEAAYLFPGTKVLWLGFCRFAQGPLLSSCEGTTCRQAFHFCTSVALTVLRVILFAPCSFVSPHSFTVCTLGWLLLASNEVIIIVLVLPALFCSVLRGSVSIGLFFVHAPVCWSRSSALA